MRTLFLIGGIMPSAVFNTFVTAYVVLILLLCYLVIQNRRNFSSGQLVGLVILLVFAPVIGIIVTALTFAVQKVQRLRMKKLSHT